MKTLKINYKIWISTLVITIGMVTSSCKKFVDVDPPSNQLVTATVFTSDNTVKSALAGMYVTFAITNSYDTEFSLSFVTGNSADETQYFTSVADFDPFVQDALQTDNSYCLSMWSSLYKSIYQANAIITGVNNSTGGISDALKAEAIGEAKFMRALCYFYLTNLWGDVPLALTTDQKVNNQLTRSSKALVYQQISKDLTDAKNTLLADYSFTSSQRTRPNKYAAIALLARLNLYNKDWPNAETNAGTLIGASSLYSLLNASALSGIFAKNNTEAILQFDNANSSDYTTEGQYYAFDNTTIPDFQLTSNLVNAFETGDRRFTSWVGVSNYQGANYYYLSKYKNTANNTIAGGEYCTYMRLAEQYLIRAEARAQQNNLGGAIADINVIRSRAGLTGTTAVTQANILLAIEQERRIELFGEYSHRWNDLRRTGRADAVLGAAKSGWKANAALYPIPKTEIQNNNNLTQNSGY
ncbi:RagB/SusD family nutrient uptake outer membrane protein [Mucilaginibacter polytrichastri]|uniref:RagB/SusD domain-containing protein n=1 Tax=Mucilaginibacter polytrichastri TaxID=1302689 RepID=A0A1Q5ZZ40_9SPHI|nr:RagB/SusD family nutrient uptake outer membrane protein [Mucilaginibacter polytrichastri]OKS87012.1 hypothetical protein RG47T_2470 [Mucilaginibacter polytrichastri]SFS85904.1 RagB/SusD domain-containing protein [Mucilaginibacter polytrichastri]